MLNGLYRNMPIFLEDNFLILEHKVSFGFVPYPSLGRHSLTTSADTTSKMAICGNRHFPTPVDLNKSS